MNPVCRAAGKMRFAKLAQHVGQPLRHSRVFTEIAGAVKLGNMIHHTVGKFMRRHIYVQLAGGQVLPDKHQHIAGIQRLFRRKLVF